MNATTLELYDIFRKTMPEIEARQAAHVLKAFVRAEKSAETAKTAEEQAEKTLSREIQHLATKEDLHLLRGEVHRTENRIVYWLIGVGVTILLAIYASR